MTPNEISLIVGIVVIAISFGILAYVLVFYQATATIDHDFTSYYQERFQNLQTPINNTAMNSTELRQVIEDQRARSFEAYNLEWYFCEKHSPEGTRVDATNARNSLDGSKITTEIVCVYDNGDIRNYVLDLDTLEREQQESIIVETRGT